MPPTAVTVASPSLPPKQDTLVLAEIVTVAAPVLFTVATPVSIHPVASVTSTLYPPAPKAVAVSVVRAWFR